MTRSVMSADSHMDLIYVPPDTFTSRMPSKFGEQVPRVVERDGAKFWVSGKAELGRYGFYGPGVAGGRRGRILVERGFASGQTRPGVFEERLEDMERDGVSAEIIYGILGISRGILHNAAVKDPELLEAIYHAYNDWIAEFGRFRPGRFYGLGCIPNQDVQVAVAEIHHCAELGLVGAVWVPWGCRLPIWHETWEPLWAAAEEAGLVLSFHVFEGGGAFTGYEVQGIRHPVSTSAWTCVAPAQMDEVLASVILAGVCERHPRLKLVLGESGIGWLPYMLERLDDTWQERLQDDIKLSMLPSEYFKRQIYATFQKDHHGVRAMAEIAPDSVMWGSDYPHRDGTWPFSQKAIEEQFRGIDESVKRRMLWENVRRCYGLDGAAR